MYEDENESTSSKITFSDGIHNDNKRKVEPEEEITDYKGAPFSHIALSNVKPQSVEQLPQNVALKWDRSDQRQVAFHHVCDHQKRKAWIKKEKCADV